MLKILKKKEFWISVLLIIVTYLVLYFLFFNLFLRIFTKHGKSTEVPEIIRMKYGEAKGKIENAGLIMEVMDSIYDPNFLPLSVISQVPLGKDRVKPGRRIFVTLNRVVPPMVKFPEDVTGGSVYQAKRQLESWRLGVEKIRHVFGQYTDLVMGVEYKGKTIKPGEQIPQGSKITLIVSKGTGRDKVLIPKLIGLNYHEAMSELFLAGLYPKMQFGEKSKEEGIVIKQYPKFAEDDSVSFGSEVTLFISGPQPKESLEGGFIDNENSKKDQDPPRDKISPRDSSKLDDGSHG